MFLKHGVNITVMVTVLQDSVISCSISTWMTS